MDDADGSLWLVTALLMEANDLIKSAGNKLNVMDFQAVNTIKTNISLVMELLMDRHADEQQLQKANHIAQNEELLSTLLLILKGHGRKS